ncbi:MAG: Mrp/NBP35 family ATP-binding protein [Nitrospirae bacterium]|nr:Mrp/NBP35 family ATP-binding protein [Nitrospirota bacterium]
MPVTEKEILAALSRIQDPDFHKDIVTLGFVDHIAVRDSKVGFEIVLPMPLFPVKEKMREEAAGIVKGLSGVSMVDVKMKSEVTGHAATDRAAIPGVKNIVAIGSGKGGVGKSTVSANLAVGLAKYGAKVGLVDGDIYGPTIPIMMGARTEELRQRDGRIIPIEAHGVKFMSMGFLATGNQPLIWRGPMAHKAVQESLLNVDWGPLDYLIVDMPPGTGDVHLTLVQTVALVGAVIVSTPQDVGLTISMKTFRMFEQTKVHPLGIIENMSYHICSHCGEREEIFGHGMVAQESERLKVPFLGEIPLDIAIRKYADQGMPIVIADPEAPSAKAYLEIIERLAAQISIRNYYSKPIQIIEEPEPNPKTFTV